MDNRRDDEKLKQLLKNLYTLTGIRTCLFDLNGDLIFETDSPSTFCSRIQRDPEGARRCRECHMQEIVRCAREGVPKAYRCHTGVCNAILPVFAGGSLYAYLTYGQYLDRQIPDVQWGKTALATSWFQGDRQALQKDFGLLPRCTQEEVKAFGQILNALSLSIRLSSLMDRAELTDLQRLELYIDRHYKEKISLSGISEALKISPSRLCASIRQNCGSKTISILIAERRVEAAKLLLSHTEDPVSSIAEAVGIPDYNYFSRVFRKITGLSPSQYRKQYMQYE